MSISIEHVKPADIEKRSFEIITEELKRMNIELTGDTAPVIKRAIHTTADFDYVKTLSFSPDAVRIMKELIKSGADIVTDTQMGMSGINKKELAVYGGSVHCFMADEDVAAEAKSLGTTRADVSMHRASRLDKPVIFAIGNAPTALIALTKMIDENQYIPAFVIGVPVGFVNVEAAKEMIMERNIPYIVNKGRKGGSNVAAALCNAVLYELRKERMEQ